jgi:Leucine-rich repeat (LRR) protein
MNGREGVESADDDDDDEEEEEEAVIETMQETIQQPPEEAIAPARIDNQRDEPVDELIKSAESAQQAVEDMIGDLRQDLSREKTEIESAPSSIDAHPQTEPMRKDDSRKNIWDKLNDSVSSIGKIIFKDNDHDQENTLQNVDDKDTFDKEVAEQSESGNAMKAGQFLSELALDFSPVDTTSESDDKEKALDTTWESYATAGKGLDTSWESYATATEGESFEKQPSTEKKHATKRDTAPSAEYDEQNDPKTLSKALFMEEDNHDLWETIDHPVANEKSSSQTPGEMVVSDESVNEPASIVTNTDNVVTSTEQPDPVEEIVIDRSDAMINVPVEKLPLSDKVDGEESVVERQGDALTSLLLLSDVIQADASPGHGTHASSTTANDLPNELPAAKRDQSPTNSSAKQSKLGKGLSKLRRAYLGAATKKPKEERSTQSIELDVDIKIQTEKYNESLARKLEMSKQNEDLDLNLAKAKEAFLASSSQNAESLGAAMPKRTPVLSRKWKGKSNKTTYKESTDVSASYDDETAQEGMPAEIAENQDEEQNEPDKAPENKVDRETEIQRLLLEINSIETALNAKLSENVTATKNNATDVPLSTTHSSSDTDSAERDSIGDSAESSESRLTEEKENSETSSSEDILHKIRSSNVDESEPGNSSRECDLGPTGSLVPAGGELFFDAVMASEIEQPESSMQEDEGEGDSDSSASFDMSEMHQVPSEASRAIPSGQSSVSTEVTSNLAKNSSGNLSDDSSSENDMERISSSQNQGMLSPLFDNNGKGGATNTAVVSTRPSQEMPSESPTEQQQFDASTGASDGSQVTDIEQGLDGAYSKPQVTRRETIAKILDRSFSIQLSRRTKILMVILFVMTIIMIGVITWLGLSNSADEDSSEAPTASPTFAVEIEINRFRDSLPDYTQVALGTIDSPQDLAFRWTITDPAFVEYAPTQRLTRFALATFYYATGGANWINNEGWLTDSNECTWYSAAPSGSCTVDDFTNLELGENSLAGTLPLEVGMLSNLLVLRAEDNAELQGTLPSTIADLSVLRQLELPNNGLVGSVPDQLRSLTSLNVLDLSGNKLSGVIPKALKSLINLTAFSVPNNMLTGSIPNAVIRNLPLAESFDIGSNQLTGSLNGLALSQLTSAINLDVSDNRLTGSIPSELGSLSQLQNLSMGRNAFTGSVPVELCLLIATTSVVVTVDCVTVQCDCGCACAL